MKNIYVLTILALALTGCTGTTYFVSSNTPGTSSIEESGTQVGSKSINDENHGVSDEEFKQLSHEEKVNHMADIYSKPGSKQISAPSKNKFIQDKSNDYEIEAEVFNRKDNFTKATDVWMHSGWGTLSQLSNLPKYKQDFYHANKGLFTGWLKFK